MRLRTLRLERYGPFTDRSINFSPDAKLHVVEGSNEAGKSCALAAVTDLFFGIERQTAYDFLHDGRELRIGATIVGRDGNCFTFRRRKGIKSTLIDAFDSPFGDDALAPYLGGLTREVFCNAFGLNADALRRGAEEILKGEGEVGTSLFAAASGMRGLVDLGRRLDDEASAIFTQRASKDRRFYQALGRFEDARRAIHDRELRAGDWKALNEKIDALSARLEEIKALRGAKAAQRARLSRNRRVAPLVRLIDRDRNRLAELGLMPEVPIGFSKILRERLEAVRRSNETRARIAGDEATASRDHAEIVVDDAVLARAADVQRLFGETGAYASNLGDLPRVRAEADEYQGLLAEFAARLGLHETELNTMLPTDAAQALIQGLISEGRALTDTLGRHTAAIATERAGAGEIERQRVSRGGVVNPRPLREKFAAIAPGLSNLQKRTDTETMIRTETRSLREAAARLNPPVIDLDALAATAVPSIETISRFRRDMETLDAERGRELDRQAAATDAIAAAESKLQELASGRPIPSAEIISAKRLQRDTYWIALRATLFGTSEALVGSQLVESVASFERHSLDADQLADGASSDAKRVAAHAVENRRLTEERSKKAAATDRIVALERRQQDLWRAWIAVWEPSGVAPLHPSEMAGWRSALDGLVDRREKLEGLRDLCVAVDAEIRNIEPALLALSAEIGLSVTEGIEVAVIAAQVERRLQSIVEAWEAARDLDSRMSDVQRRIETLVASEAEARRKLDDWSARWSLALPEVGMPVGTGIEQAEAALGVWIKVPGTLRERNNRGRRVAGMQRNIEAFERQAKDLLNDIAPDLAGLPADVAVKMLNDRLIAARAAETRRTESQRRITKIIRAREGADVALTEAERALEAVAEKLPQDADLMNMLDRLTERDDLLDDLEERQTQLIAQAEGYDEYKLRADLTNFNSDGVESVLAVLENEEQELEREMQEIFAAHSEAARQRAQAEQGMGAEVAVQQQSSAEAELLAASREWLRLKFGALLVATAIGRRRAEESDPLLTRAGILFAMLTGNSFSGIGQEFDEHDAPRLVGRRPTGEAVKISGMSTGARDQFYLALRLAYLEEYASGAEPAPFIGDDLFASFDENRTANGLAALAAIGDLVQPIVFTHHRYLADIARTILGAEVIAL
jgi:uncharacterized protein YhaN